jgi:hypothetical protein
MCHLNIRQIISFSIRTAITSFKLKTVKYLWKIFSLTLLQTICVQFLNVHTKIAKHAIFLSLQVFKKQFNQPRSYTKTGYNLTCRSSNVGYGIECTLCGLIYIGETKGSLNKCISGHRFEINNGGQQLLYKHLIPPIIPLYPWKSEL